MLELGKIIFFYLSSIKVSSKVGLLGTGLLNIGLFCTGFWAIFCIVFPKLKDEPWKFMDPIVWVEGGTIELGLG